MVDLDEGEFGVFVANFPVTARLLPMLDDEGRSDFQQDLERRAGYLAQDDGYEVLSPYLTSIQPVDGLYSVVALEAVARKVTP